MTRVLFILQSPISAFNLLAPLVILRLTPLGFDHIRLTGRYDFTLTAQPETGGLRPLRRV